MIAMGTPKKKTAKGAKVTKAAKAAADPDDPLDQGYRLHARTTAEIADRVDSFLSRLRGRNLKFRGRKVKLEPFINVLVREFFKLGEAAQEELMMREIPLFDAILGGEPDDVDPPAVGDGGRSITPQVEIRKLGDPPGGRRGHREA